MRSTSQNQMPSFALTQAADSGLMGSPPPDPPCVLGHGSAGWVGTVSTVGAVWSLWQCSPLPWGVGGKPRPGTNSAARSGRPKGESQGTFPCHGLLVFPNHLKA